MEIKIQFGKYCHFYAAPRSRDSSAAFHRHFAVQYTTEHASNTNSAWPEVTLRNKTIIIIHYLLAPWHRVLLEKLTGFAASQEIPRIYGT
jgi:hypothetical protein